MDLDVAKLQSPGAFHAVLFVKLDEEMNTFLSISRLEGIYTAAICAYMRCSVCIHGRKDFDEHFAALREGKPDVFDVSVRLDICDAINAFGGHLQRRLRGEGAESEEKA